MKHRTLPTALALALTSSALTAQAWEVCEPLVTKNGNQPGDEFGFLVANVGDLDGDETSDFMVGAPFALLNRGRIKVFSGATGQLIFKHTGAPFEFLGWQGGAAGDVDGDGTPDVVASAPALTFDQTPGHVYVFSGVDGSILHKLAGQSPNDKFGDDCAGAGDVNQDGYGDVVVGAPLRSNVAEFSGRAYVFSGFDGSVLHQWDGEGQFDTLGAGVAGLPDYDGDGHPEVLVAAGGAGPPEDPGEAHIYSGATGAVLATVEADPTTDGGFYGLFYLGPVGDVNADGVEDFSVSDIRDGGGGDNAGRVYVYSGADFSHLYSLYGQEASETFGVGSGQLGDVDGDGHDDLVYCSSRATVEGNNAGKVTVFSGADGSVLGRYHGDTPGERFGFDVAPLGDVDGDGAVELAVATRTASVQGRVDVISWSPRPPYELGSPQPRSSGPGVQLSYRNSTSVTENEFALTGDGGPAGAGTLLLVAAASFLEAPFPPVLVVPSPSLDAEGAVEIPLDFGPSAASLVGPTFHFQLWYLDPESTPHLLRSNELAASFCP